jgi:transposase
MARYVSSDDRNQIEMQPMCLDDLISPNCEVRALDAIVDNMGIPSMGFIHSETKDTGRKPYDPVDLFKLYVYSYFNGIRSSRKIERECYRNIEVMWLVNGLRPDFKTIADFRKDNKKQIKQAFRKFSMICDELGLVGKEMIAVDGSKFRASNSRLAYHSEKKIQKKIEHYNMMTEQYLTLLDSCDQDEKDSQSAVPDRAEIESKISNITRRLAELDALKEHVQEHGTVYATDPDARMMQMNNKGCDICHNVQIAVDEKAHIVVAVDVTSEPVDKEQLHSMSLQAKEELGVDTITVIADKGYYSASQFAKCKDDNIIPIVSKADHSNTAATRGFGKQQFKYDEATDGYICPEGYLLKPYQPKKENAKYKGIRRYRNYEACAQCKSRSKCSLGVEGRTIQDREFQRIADEVDRRREAHPEMYQKRKQMAEHPFGTVKRSWGYSYFLTRRTASVRVESLLHFLTYNMKRAIHTIGVQELVLKMQR